MKIAVIGGTGLIGSKVTAILRGLGHEVVAAAPNTGVNTITGEGLDEALAGAEIVVDLANSPSFDPDDVYQFFLTHEDHLLSAEIRAGVRHHVVLSIVGIDRSPENGYFRAKVAQENQVIERGQRHTIVRSTQFMEFLGAIADAGETNGQVHIAPGMFQPIAADDVAVFVAEAALSEPDNAVVEIAGPDRLPLDEVIRGYLKETGDRRAVVTDASARYFGGLVDQLSLVPLGEAKLGQVKLADWIARRREAPALLRKA
ncbi:NmrA family transcriptional regulator [Sphingomonas sp. MAH-20]|uniref:NmrA family transcriptional regulator n=1 Tax=Sphingomonas horti TaxID=2682842 RepID=A0A6I4IY11_9SPHN|nr:MULTISPECIES: SDR family oxidoreductase [Sphingomonas]MBA2920872.1 SDR family oxidoreductase [Sphingomonas sp. CGMCC 1.13658]MVO76858.1 NmrA family transcriptional regulator [Sphingomonas horti]